MFDENTCSRFGGHRIDSRGGLVLSVGPSGMPPGQIPPSPTYQQQYRPTRQLPQQAPKGDSSGLVMTVLGVITFLFTVLIFVSTFLPWITIGSVSKTGMNIMNSPGQGFFMISWGWGGILFSGFFSLLFGALMIIPAILLLLNKPGGAAWAIVLSVFVFFIALVNIIMVYSTFGNYGGASVGGGLWSMLASAVVVLVCGIVALRVS